MTEPEWLAATDGGRLYALLRRDFGDGDEALARKYRLYACGRVRQMWAESGDGGWPFAVEAVEVAERWADGLAADAEAAAVRRQAAEPACRTLRRPARMAASDLRGDDPFLWRCVFGNPYRPPACDPAWRTQAAVELAEAIYAEHAFDRLPILADALQDAGCASEAILAHCRGGGCHARGCWVVDLVLGKG